jgi:hypothetical protein
VLTLNQGVSSLYSVNFAKFTPSNTGGCPVLSYSLLDASNAPYAGVPAPVITATGYEIKVPTDCCPLVTKTFIIRAQAEGGAVTDSPPINFLINCGGETLTALNQTPTEVVVSKNANVLVPISPNWDGYWSTDEPLCDVTNFKLRAPDAVTEATVEIYMIDGNDPSLA